MLTEWKNGGECASLHRFYTTVGIIRLEQNRPKQDMYRYQKEDTNRKKKFILSLDSTAVKGLFTPEFKMTENIYWGISSKHGGFQMAE